MPVTRDKLHNDWRVIMQHRSGKRTVIGFAPTKEAGHAMLQQAWNERREKKDGKQEEIGHTGTNV